MLRRSSRNHGKMLSPLTFPTAGDGRRVLCSAPMSVPRPTPARAGRPLGAALVLALASAAAFAAPADNDVLGRFIEGNAKAATPAAAVAPAAAASATAPAAGTLASRLRDQASEMVLTAMNFLGVRYRRGGNDAETGFDCSGFTRHVFETSVGLVLPRRADEQARAPGLIPVRLEDLRPGDLVFFNTLKRTFSHVGIYVGDGKFIHSPRPGGEVRVEDMGFAYWKKRFTGARRAELETTPPAAVAPEATATTPAARPTT
jgi:cell wall-associated NlpC family hydrolase